MYCGIRNPALSSSLFGTNQGLCRLKGFLSNKPSRSPILACVAHGNKTSRIWASLSDIATRGTCGAHVASRAISSILRQLYDFAAVRFCNTFDPGVIGTSGPKSTEDARGNSRKARDSFFYKSELTGVIDE